MRVSYIPCRAVDGLPAYDVVVTHGDEEMTVAHIRYDKWTAQWALLHQTGLIEKFDTVISARSGAESTYG
jgi:hypothetical protein